MNITLKWQERFMNEAKSRASWSKDPSTGVGCVAVNPDRKTVIGSGYNGFPRGIVDTKKRYNNREEKYKRVVHAEMNCIYNACYDGVSLVGSSLFVYGIPVCSKCSLGVIQVGIEEVYIPVYSNPNKRWIEDCQEAVENLKEAGVKIIIIKDYLV